LFQFYIIFILLVLEAIGVTCLLFPLPSFIVHAVLALLRNLRYGIRFTFACLLFFTVDQTWEMRKEEQILENMPSNVDLGKDSFYRTRKFRAERNFYLCTFTFALLVILMRLETIVTHTKQIEHQLKEATKNKSQ